jgi:hypothetical protein
MPDRPGRDPAEDRRRIGRAVAEWGALALASVSVLSALVVWHLVRRGRLIRENLGPPRVVQLPEGEPAAEPAPPDPSKAPEPD